jgi:hypothetical protein
VAVGGVAFAAIPDSGGTIHACYGKSNGNLRAVESEGDCRSNESPLSWNQQGPPGPPGNANASFDQEPSEVSTTSDAYVDLGGPAVTVDVPSGGLIEFFAGADLRGQPGCQQIALFEDDTIVAPAILSCANTDWVQKWVAPSVGSGGNGTFDRAVSTWNTMETTPGSHTYSLRYRTDTTQSDTAFFRNRKIWVAPR